MNTASTQWIHENHLPEDIVNYIHKQQLPSYFATYFWHRNIKDPKLIDQFLNPELSQLHDPFLMYDMDQAVERIQEAIMNEEVIGIYGDYDVDGITSTALLVETLEQLGAHTVYLIPDRKEYGYGPHTQLWIDWIQREHISLLITVDNGISACDIIQEVAQTVNIDIIITDHHQLPEHLPDVYAIIHPNHPKGDYPYPELCGVGVVFKLATALLEEIPIESLDLVALGTLADQVPLLDENRVLVTYGLASIKAQPRLGLAILLNELALNHQTLDTEQLAFQVIPCCNAPGRLSSALPVVELLLTFDDIKAKHISQTMIQINQQRKEEVDRAFHHILKTIKQQDAYPILCVTTTAPEGVLGIIASKLVKHTGKPTLVFTQGAYQTHSQILFKGSGRAPEGFDLYQHLLSAQSLFHAFGGHDAAIGCSIEKDKLKELKDYLKQLDLHFSKPQKFYDITANVKDLGLPFLDDIAVLQPFGQGNPAPIIHLTQGMIVHLKTIGKKKEHLSFSWKDQTGSLSCISFFNTQLQDDLMTVFPDDAVNIELLGTLHLNEWNQVKSAQFHLLDYKIKGTQLIDARDLSMMQLMKQYPDACWLIFNETTERLDHQVLIHEVFLFTQLPTASVYIFYDAPLSKQQWDAVKEQLTGTQLVLYTQGFIGSITKDSIYHLYQLLKRQSLDVRYKLKDIAHYLHVSPDLLIEILKALEANDYITIQEGMASINPKIPSWEHLYDELFHNQKGIQFWQNASILTIKKWLGQHYLS